MSTGITEDRLQSAHGKLAHERRATQCARRRLVDWASGDLYPATAVIILPRATWLRWVALLQINH